MAHFTSENAAEHGRRGGQQSHQRRRGRSALRPYANLVLTNPSAASRVAELIRQGYRLVLALRVVKVVNRMNEGGH